MILETQKTDEMPYRIPLNFVGNGKAIKAYGGSLEAWSFIDIDPLDWFSNFQSKALASIGREFFPIYRMADGEYRFLMGRFFNRNKKPIIKEVASYLLDKSGIRNQDKWSTSWGESYDPALKKNLTEKYISDIYEISKSGMLALYINNNGLNAFTEYNSSVVSFLRSKGIELNSSNYIPFHFPCELLTGNYRSFFYRDRNLLVITGLNAKKEFRIKNTLEELGAKSVQFIGISSNKSMQDKIDLTSINMPVDVCLVAAGIGASNIINQLKNLNTLCIDIGGLVGCFETPSKSIHGGTFSIGNIIKYSDV